MNAFQLCEYVNRLSQKCRDNALKWISLHQARQKIRKRRATCAVLMTYNYHRITLITNTRIPSIVNFTQANNASLNLLKITILLLLLLLLSNLHTITANEGVVNVPLVSNPLCWLNSNGYLTFCAGGQHAPHLTKLKSWKRVVNQEWYFIILLRNHKIFTIWQNKILPENLPQTYDVCFLIIFLKDDNKEIKDSLIFIYSVIMLFC